MVINETSKSINIMIYDDKGRMIYNDDFYPERNVTLNKDTSTYEKPYIGLCYKRFEKTV